MSGISRFDLASLDLLRESHPAWWLLQVDRALFVISFLHRTVITEQLPESEVLRCLEDHLREVR